MVGDSAKFSNDASGVVGDLAKSVRSLRRRQSSERDVVTNLVIPVLKRMGYTQSSMVEEYTVDHRRRLDIALWGAKSAFGSAPPSVIVEVKALDTDFDAAPSAVKTPQRQIETYMVGSASRPNVWGVLTDGIRWRVLRRDGAVDIARVGEWTVPDDVDGLHEVSVRIGHETCDTMAVIRRRPRRPSPLLELLADEAAPRDILKALGGHLEAVQPIEPDDAAARLAAKNEWAETAWTFGSLLAREQGSLLEDHRIVVGFARLKTPLVRDDIHVVMKSLAMHSPVRVAAATLSHQSADGVNVCFATHAGGRTSVGARFDPAWPDLYATETVADVSAKLAKGEVAAAEIDNLLSNSRLHKDFFGDVRRWIALRMAGKSLMGRAALLRHLLRCVFAWAMKGCVGIPERVFEPSWRASTGVNSYHDDVIRFLFHKRLNRSKANRGRHENHAVHDALAAVRFLNGSLFAEHAGEELELTDNDYFGHGADGSEGLWTIFRRHGWTTQEENAQTREQSIDPKMLGLLFEQLIAAVEQGDADELMERMPAGTYYTPVDVVWEMAKEAVTARLLQEPLPGGWHNADVDRLLEDGPEEPPPKGRKAMIGRLAGLTVFDPAVGSGEFVLGCVRAIRKGLTALRSSEPSASVRRIVEDQIFAQDINPLAVAVARLRLFMAIEESEGDLAEPLPLPNLEAKIVCADTVGTEIRSAGQRQLADDDPLVQRRLAECQSLQDEFMRAHQPRRKQTLRHKRKRAGNALAEALTLAGNTEGSLHAFALHDYLNHDNDKPVATDPRWTFGRAADGFDIVIGNPPYVGAKPSAMGKGKVNAIKRQARRNGYHPFDDIYALFCEAAMELSHPTLGVVSLVVPLSLSFAATKVHVRDSYLSRCSSIRLRHQDNRPDKTFGNSPVEHAENRQRTTVITASRGEGECELQTSGLGRWSSSDRPRYFQQRQYVPWNVARVSGKLSTDLAAQWPRLCTQEAAEIIAAVAERGEAPKWRGPAAIGLPKSAMYFVTAAPAGLLNRGESCLPCPRRGVDVALAVFNSGVAYLWWKAWDDGFHVKADLFAQMPDFGTIVGRAELDRLGARIRRVLQEGKRDVRQSGTGGGRLTENMNLWQTAPAILHEVDSLLLAGLGFDDVNRFQQALALERSNSVLAAHWN